MGKIKVSQNLLVMVVVLFKAWLFIWRNILSWIIVAPLGLISELLSFTLIIVRILPYFLAGNNPYIKFCKRQGVIQAKRVLRQDGRATAEVAQGILTKRLLFVDTYCKDKGWDAKMLTPAQALEIRSQEGWRDPK